MTEKNNILKEKDAKTVFASSTKIHSFSVMFHENMGESLSELKTESEVEMGLFAIFEGIVSFCNVTPFFSPFSNYMIMRLLELIS